MVTAVRGATAMLLHAIRIDSPGQPLSRLIHIPRKKDISFLHTKYELATSADMNGALTMWIQAWSTTRGCANNAS